MDHGGQRPNKKSVRQESNIYLSKILQYSCNFFYIPHFTWDKQLIPPINLLVSVPSKQTKLDQFLLQAAGKNKILQIKKKKKTLVFKPANSLLNFEGTLEKYFS